MNEAYIPPIVGGDPGNLFARGLGGGQGSDGKISEGIQVLADAGIQDQEVSEQGSDSKAKILNNIFEDGVDTAFSNIEEMKKVFTRAFADDEANGRSSEATQAEFYNFVAVYKDMKFLYGNKGGNKELAEIRDILRAKYSSKPSVKVSGTEGPAEPGVGGALVREQSPDSESPEPRPYTNAILLKMIFEEGGQNVLVNLDFIQEYFEKELRDHSENAKSTAYYLEAQRKFNSLRKEIEVIRKNEEDLDEVKRILELGYKVVRDRDDLGQIPVTKTEFLNAIFLDNDSSFLQNADRLNKFFSAVRGTSGDASEAPGDASEAQYGVSHDILLDVMQDINDLGYGGESSEVIKISLEDRYNNEQRLAAEAPLPEPPSVHGAVSAQDLSAGAGAEGTSESPVSEQDKINVLAVLSRGGPENFDSNLTALKLKHDEIRKSNNQVLINGINQVDRAIAAVMVDLTGLSSDEARSEGKSEYDKMLEAFYNLPTSVGAAPVTAGTVPAQGSPRGSGPNGRSISETVAEVARANDPGREELLAMARKLQQGSRWRGEQLTRNGPMAEVAGWANRPIIRARVERVGPLGKLFQKGKEGVAKSIRILSSAGGSVSKRFSDAVLGQTVNAFEVIKKGKDLGIDGVRRGAEKALDSSVAQWAKENRFGVAVSAVGAAALYAGWYAIQRQFPDLSFEEVRNYFGSLSFGGDMPATLDDPFGLNQLVSPDSAGGVVDQSLAKSRDTVTGVTDMAVYGEDGNTAIASEAAGVGVPSEADFYASSGDLELNRGLGSNVNPAPGDFVRGEGAEEVRSVGVGRDKPKSSATGLSNEATGSDMGVRKYFEEVDVVKPTIGSEVSEAARGAERTHPLGEKPLVPKNGDSLWKLLAERLAGDATYDQLPQAGKNNVIGNLLQQVKSMKPEDLLKELGLKPNLQVFTDVEIPADKFKFTEVLDAAKKRYLPN